MCGEQIKSNRDLRKDRLIVKNDKNSIKQHRSAVDTLRALPDRTQRLALADRSSKAAAQRQSSAGHTRAVLKCWSTHSSVHTSWQEDSAQQGRFGSALARHCAAAVRVVGSRKKAYVSFL